jgi:nucleotide-binding universal stress UspA family protein
VAETHLREGRPAEEITALAEGVGADLVVVGGREMGALGRLALGSVSKRVAREASRPVLVVRGGWPPSRVVVGDDLSEEAGRAGELAAIVGGLYGAPVRLTTAYTPGNWYVGYAAHRRRTRETERGIGRALRGRAAALGKALGEKPHTEVAPRRPDDVLQEASEEGKATLVAVGRRDLGAARRAVTGSVSGGVLGSAGGPVLVVPSSAGKGSQDGERGRSRLRGRPASMAPTSRRPRTSAKTGDYPR